MERHLWTKKPHWIPEILVRGYVTSFLGKIVCPTQFETSSGRIKRVMKYADWFNQFGSLFTTELIWSRGSKSQKYKKKLIMIRVLNKNVTVDYLFTNGAPRRPKMFQIGVKSEP